MGDPVHPLENSKELVDRVEEAYANLYVELRDNAIKEAKSKEENEKKESVIRERCRE